MLDQSELNTLKTNDKLEHFLLISSFNVKNTKTGKQYLDMTLRDRSIELNAKMWSNFETFVEQAFIGSVVKVLGVIARRRGRRRRRTAHRILYSL